MRSGSGEGPRAGRGRAASVQEELSHGFVRSGGDGQAIALTAVWVEDDRPLRDQAVLRALAPEERGELGLVEDHGVERAAGTAVPL